ncbi:putative ATPase with chaperone activity [Sphingomonas sp. BE270]|jgi:hypothetical protein|uniref:hypothetical protein n=1 Tax=Sphingomonas sp. BE270 TaxID=2817726 RepID=UPI002860DBC5|nr:hypothetical protein [Sphingomonas sp. BE270]MDR7256318.1 putative ATPase with chaperone activity [Sphingomonas sp. BE270]
MASNAPVEKSGSRSQRAAIDTLRHKALEKLTLAIAKAVESASDDTLADIIGSEDLRHALVIAPRDIAPQAPADIEAIRSARERTAQFREEMAKRAGGMFDRAHIAAMLGVTPAAIEKQRQRRQILGVPYGSENRYPAAQFARGEALPHFKQVLEAFGDTNPWEQLMLLTTPLEGYGMERETPFEILMRRPGSETVQQLLSLVAGWAA